MTVTTARRALFAAVAAAALLTAGAGIGAASAEVPGNIVIDPGVRVNDDILKNLPNHKDDPKNGQTDPDTGKDSNPSGGAETDPKTDPDTAPNAGTDTQADDTVDPSTDSGDNGETTATTSDETRRSTDGTPTAATSADDSIVTFALIGAGVAVIAAGATVVVVARRR
ncbi:hypothetical protein nbrc107696_07790 [Gordonia spumicola]|uniref:Gram-positive cocci surface proteins LPxTG domain-containing protein n=1 Tax=Gordonia spumicola TaxID=589161 RepID=A0A7I9V562_9ACTN|nr:hypothetical protein [Gordonia spumicola]GEE00333.1 hypothetical protein nbrc107696_07790 [Gordonia spumicola]